MKKQVWKKSVERMLGKVKKASIMGAQLSSELKAKVLAAAAKELEKQSAFIMAQNAKDLVQGKAGGLTSALLDRLTLNEKRISEMAEGLRMVARLQDPVGKLLDRWKRPNGLKISKVSVPIGVILIIYEARPNVTVECASLCFKSGNAVILRGGREAFHSNRALVSIFKKILKRFKLPLELISFIETTDREAVDYLLKQNESIHLVIPRGGETLIRKVVELSRIPVIKHYQGICHVYVDEKADLAKAVKIILNAKLQRPGVCNAAETLLVHQNIAARFLPLAGKKLMDEGCELRADQKSMRYLPAGAKHAGKKDFGHEFLDKVLAVKTVPSLEAAIQHIQRYSSAHTDAIVTENPKSAQIFKALVDSSSVMVNASTRFSDGFQYGFGAEIGISTDKIHARGPMGLEGLTSYKYLVEGNGHVRE